MKQEEYHAVERKLKANKLVPSPVLNASIRGGLSNGADGSACGLVVLGSSLEPTRTEREIIFESVRRAGAVGLPVLALSDAVDLVLDAAGFCGAPDEHTGIVLHEGVRILESEADLDDAIRSMAQA
jgi:hypothetical protein